MQHVIKANAHTEPFDIKKIERACLRAGLNTHLKEPLAQKICNKVAVGMTEWMESRKAVTSVDIFEQVILLLMAENEDVAFMFETHLDIN